VISGQNTVAVQISPQSNSNVQVAVTVVFAAPLYTVTYTPSSGSGIYLAQVSKTFVFFSWFFSQFSLFVSNLLRCFVFVCKFLVFFTEFDLLF
jgi:hypothetical protein